MKGDGHLACPLSLFPHALFAFSVREGVPRGRGEAATAAVSYTAGVSPLLLSFLDTGVTNIFITQDVMSCHMGLQDVGRATLCHCFHANEKRSPNVVSKHKGACLLGVSWKSRCEPRRLSCSVFASR